MAIAPPSPHPFRCLSSAEFTECHRQGLCYHCDEQYVQGHQCQCLFYIEVTDPDEDRTRDAEEIGPATETLALSSYAMAGIHTENTLQLHISVANHHIVALLRLDT